MSQFSRYGKDSRSSLSCRQSLSRRYHLVLIRRSLLPLHVIWCCPSIILQHLEFGFFFSRSKLQRNSLCSVTIVISVVLIHRCILQKWRNQNRPAPIDHLNRQSMCEMVRQHQRYVNLFIRSKRRNRPQVPQTEKHTPSNHEIHDGIVETGIMIKRHDDGLVQDLM